MTIMRLYLASFAFLFVLYCDSMGEITIWEEVRVVNGEQRAPAADDAIEKKYDRFFLESGTNAETQPEFIGKAYNWTGVGRGTVANHFGTAIGGSFMLVRGTLTQSDQRTN